MWPKLALNKVLRKSLSSSSFVADSPDLSAIMPEFHRSDASTMKACNRQTCEIFVSSWNVGGIVPPEDMDMEYWLDIKKCQADIYVFGFQEIVPLSAGNVLSSENRKISGKWNAMIRETLNKSSSGARPGHSSTAGGQSKEHFRCIVSKQMVGIFISVWVRSNLCEFVNHPTVSCVGCGIMGCLGNKGSVSVRFLLGETSFCFICSHLASGGRERDARHRNSDATEILLRTTFPHGPSRNLPRKILDHDRVIWLGDLNYRIHLPDTTTRSLVEQGKWDLLLEKDQLKAELMEGHVFQGWQEGVIKFAPTYKYCPNSEAYYGENPNTKVKKSRAPAWCDRIIWFGKGLKQSQYDRGESKLSDHRPVRAIFTAETGIYRVLQNSEVSNRRGLIDTRTTFTRVLE
ncbi:type IV inositol polyphosphate 5-phosphatase 9-like [Rhodamnia argentea]|uniref:Type IV inositol polyphosphate 5-phosphatase 9-like n=1 Tax=Rhodamnia argentea TaxID=178133 RepID=A0A8B8Q2G2_9MYRT|nr:type IV inositol polyphosphate 5-phosphatase 9-like [Rhodamnia argentea]